MCGRLNISNDEKMHHLLGSMGVDFGEFPVRYNIAPTDQVPVIHNWEGKRIISDMRWWLVPHWSGGPSTKFSMFNARSETLDKSRAYQGSFRHKRCVIPVSSYIEWQRFDDQKRPFSFSRADGALSLAGLWDYWSDGIEHILSCSVITTAASDDMRLYHKRMPVMLDDEGSECWLNEKQDAATLKALFNYGLPYTLGVSELDQRVNLSTNKAAPVVVGSPLFIS